jgi:hypothetical protein
MHFKKNMDYLRNYFGPSGVLPLAADGQDGPQSGIIITSQPPSLPPVL